MTNTIPNVPRELLERVAKPVLFRSQEDAHADACAELRALLSAPSPAGVDGLEVVGYVSRDDIKWQGDCTLRLKPYSDYTIPLCRLSDAAAIIDGLRGEVAELQSMITNLSRAGIRMRTERDQQAQRIGELEGLLREVHDTYRAAVHWEDLRGTMRRIDAALSAGKEGE